MGKTGIYNYQVQVEVSPGRYCILGAMKYKEALKEFFVEAVRISSRIGYIWPQTKAGKKKLKADYIQVEINDYDRIIETPKQMGDLTNGSPQGNHEKI